MATLMDTGMTITAGFTTIHAGITAAVTGRNYTGITAAPAAAAMKTPFPSGACRLRHRIWNMMNKTPGPAACDNFL